MAERSGLPVRFKVAALLIVLGMITYVDRACIATLRGPMQHDLGLTTIQMGYIFTIFSVAYAVFGIPGGVLADRLGTRLTLTLIVVGWSICTILTGEARGFWELLVIRFLFGAAEAGAWPSVARTFAQWLPRSERGRLQGMFFAGSHFAAGATAYLVTGLLRSWSWREIFLSFGAAGLVWAAVWAVWFRNQPASHRATSAKERALIGPRLDPVPEVSWRALGRLFLQPRVWTLCGLYFPLSTFFYFCITWLPTYLKDRRGLDPREVVLFTALPQFLAAAADLLGGWFTDAAVARFGLRNGYRFAGAGAYAVSIASIVAAPLVPSPIAAGLLISLGMGASMFTLPAAWSASTEIGQEQAAAVSAAMNTSGQIGSAIGPLIVAYALSWFNSWTLSIEVMGGFFAIGFFCWLRLRLD